MDQVLLSNTEVSKQNGVLRLFIGLVQLESSCKIKECSEKDCATVLNWLSSNQLDINKKDWYRTKDGKEIPQLQENLFENEFLDWILELKDILSFLLKSNGNIQFVDENRKTILHVFLEDYLSRYDLQKPSLINCEMIKLLMDKGVPVETADQNGNTPLHIAAKLRAIPLVEIMLENYLNVNACNNQGDTVLHILCSEISYDSDADLIQECAQSLLLKGANVNLQNKMGWTPAHFTAKCGYLNMLKIFLRSGATLNILTNDHESLLLLACKYALLSCFRSRSSELVKLLINSGCNVNETDQKGCSPLHYACNSYLLVLACFHDVDGHDWHSCFTDRSVLKPLVEADADVNAETADGTTPLLSVALSQLSDAVKYLHQEGADISRRENIFGFTTLHMAALGIYEENLEYLLEQGLDVDDGGIYGITALHLASFRKNVGFMKMLIARGADVHRRENVTKSTALHFLAKEGRVLDYISLICDVKRKPFWNTRPFRGNLSIIIHKNAVALLVNHGVDVNAKDVYGRTPIHLATIYAGGKKYLCEELGQYPIIGLLKCGAYVDIQDDEGNLPLHNALKTGHTKALDYLLKFGVDVNEADTSSIVLSCKKEGLKCLVFQHLVKLRAAELPVSKAYSLHANDPKFESLCNDCLREVEQMKSFVIDDDTSLYDFLHVGWRRRSDFAQKLPTDLQQKFPEYAGIIQASCREAVQRKPLLESAKLGWYRITEVDLPDICVECIIAHLKNRYLRVLAEGLFEDGA